jgi:ubiquinone/menaquinone biosynthesis C-methylase UbiE
MEGSGPGTLDRWRSDAPADEASLRELVEFVETRARSPDEIETRQAYLDLLELRPGDRVLDAGCGSGVVTREIARRVSPGGKVLGVDTNPYLLEEARRQVAGQEDSEAVEWRRGDARRLDLADASMDVVVCVTLLAHIPGSEPVVGELVRVLRPGGRIGIFEIDPESFIVAHPDVALTRRVLNAANDYGFANAWVSRRVPGLMEEAGIGDLSVRAYTSLEREATGFLARAARLRPVIAERAGAITHDEAQRWLALLQAEMDAGRFLAGTTYVFSWGVKAGGG